MRKRANSRYKSGPSILAAVIGLNRAMRERLWERMAGMPGGAEGNSDQHVRPFPVMVVAEAAGAAPRKNLDWHPLTSVRRR
jgi:hypothetical protein